MFVSELRYLAAFSNADGSKSSDVENEAKFRTFCLTSEIRGEVGEISGSVMKLHLRPNVWNTFDGRPLRGC